MYSRTAVQYSVAAAVAMPESLSAVAADGRHCQKVDPQIQGLSHPVRGCPPAARGLLPPA